MPGLVQNSNCYGLLQTEPSPDWKGRAAVAAGNGGKSRNPGKRVKITSMQFLPASFLAKTCPFFLANKRRAVHGAIVYKVKIAWFWPVTECRAQFYHKVCSREEKKALCLQYLKKFGIPFIKTFDKEQLSKYNKLHEGLASVFGKKKTLNFRAFHADI